MTKKENPVLTEGVNANPAMRLHSSLAQLLGQASLLAIGGVLVDNALRGGLINRGGGRGQLHIGGRGIGSNSSLELLHGSTDSALDHAITQVLLRSNLHALLSGLDIRQLLSPPADVNCLSAVYTDHVGTV